MSRRKDPAGLAGTLWQVLVLGVVVWALPGHCARAATDNPAASAVPAQAPSQHVCVDAEVNGERALSYDCLTQRLAPPPAAQDADASNAAEALVKSPSNKAGTFNWSAESIRFGSSWQKSAIPQRPAPVPAVPPALH